MSGGQSIHDPLTFGGDNEVLEDLTAHLNDLTTSSVQDPLTLGGSTLLAGSDTDLLGAPTTLLPSSEPHSNGAPAPPAPGSMQHLLDPEAPTSMSDPLATYGQLVTPTLPPAAPSSTTAAAAGSAAAAAAGGIAGSATPAGGSSMTPAASGPLSASASSTTPFEGGAAGGAGPLASSSSSPPGSSGVSRHPSGMEGLLAGEPSGGWLSPTAPRPAAGGPPPIKVVVGEPVKKDSAGMFGMKGSHVEYPVTSSSSLPGWPAGQVAVLRRFKDFVSLADVLKAKYRGYFVPPRPEKNAVEGQRQSEGFIAERRAALERYLAKLGAHPLVGPGEELRLFLTLPGELGANFQWAGLVPAGASVMESTARFSMQLIGRESKVIDPVAAAQPAAASKDLLRALKEASTGLGMRGGREVPATELEMRRGREAVEEMAAQLAATSKAAERFVSRLDKVGCVAGDLGLALFKLAKFEEAEGGPLATSSGTVRYSSSLIQDEKRAAAALMRVSKMMTKVTGRSALELGALHDTLGFMPAVVRGLMSREHCLLTCHTLEGDLEARQKALTDLESGATKPFGGDRARVKQIDELRLEVSRLQIAIGVAQGEYDKIAAANRGEMGRFNRERGGEYLNMVESLAATQVAASERLHEVWLQLARELGATPTQLAALPQVTPTSGALCASLTGGGSEAPAG